MTTTDENLIVADEELEEDEVVNRPRYRYWVLLEFPNVYRRWPKNQKGGYDTRDEAVNAVKGKGVVNWVIARCYGKPPIIMEF